MILIVFISWSGCTSKESHKILEVSMPHSIFTSRIRENVALIRSSTHCAIIYYTSYCIAVKWRGWRCPVPGQSSAAAAAAARWRAFSALASAARCFFCASPSTLRCFFSAAALDRFPKFPPKCFSQIGISRPPISKFTNDNQIVYKYLHHKLTQGYGKSWKHHNSHNKSERWKTRVARVSSSRFSAGAWNGSPRKIARYVHDCPLLATVRIVWFGVRICECRNSEWMAASWQT